MAAIGLLAVVAVDAVLAKLSCIVLNCSRGFGGFRLLLWLRHLIGVGFGCLLVFRLGARIRLGWLCRIGLVARRCRRGNVLLLGVGGGFVDCRSL